MRHRSRSGFFSTLVITASFLFSPPGVRATPLFSLTQTFPKPTPLAEDNFGNAVATIGSNVLVGAAADNVWATSAGAAYLYDSTNGTLIRSFKATDPQPYDAFGYSVAACGTDVLVGALYDDTASVDAGAVYLFDGSNGNLKRVFVSPAPSSSEQFGFALACAGNTVFVGAPGGVVVGGPPGGAVYAFNVTTGDLLWGQTGNGQDGFGGALAVVGANVLVGAPFDDTGASLAGSAYLLDIGNGQVVMTLHNPTPDTNESFGFSVAAVDNGDLLIGAPFENTKAPAAGAAYLFDGDSGMLLKTFYDPSPLAQEWFGSAVAPWGTSGVLIAAAYDSTHATNAGAVYLYDTTSTSYALLSTFKKSTPVSQDLLGASIATVDLDVVVGVPGDDTGAENAGLVLYFQKAASCGDGHVDPGEACDDGNTLDGDCCNATCTVVATDGNPCSDGSNCTASDVCQGGFCVGTNLCDDNNPCTVDTCANKSTGACRHKVVSDSSNTPCPDDGSVCTFDVCSAGVCSHPNKCDNHNMCDGVETCTPDDTVTAGFQCSAGSNLPNGTTCDDSNACTLNTTCQNGLCQSATAKCDDRLPCQTGLCVNTTTGTCRYTKVDDSSNIGCTPDSNICTLDVCRSGACAHPPKCDDGNDCTIDTCDGNGVCTNTTKTNGTACDDYNACTLNTTCLNGTCQGGNAKCDDRAPCQVGTCASTTTGACRYTKVLDSSNVACGTDNDNCTTDVCRNGACAHPPKCVDGNDCTTDTCNPQDGSCSYPAKTDGVSCDDFNACTINTTCSSGVCQGGGAKCDDRAPCQIGTCTSTTTGACRYTKAADNTACGTDNDNCTNDLCLNGACTHPFKCSDGNDCTTDTCNPENGVCSYPAKTNGTACDDVNACTLNTTCSNGVCQGGTAKCDDRLPCQTGTCTSTTTGSCRYTKVADNTVCDSDGNNCTNDLCVNGACTHPFKCSDGNDCTTDTCNPVDGSCSYPAKTNGTACDDFNACTINTTCAAGVCQGGGAKCDDRLPCQTGSCTSTTTGNCRYTKVADNTACTSDGDICTNDLCLNGACTHPSKCADGNDCTYDYCDANGICSNPSKGNGVACDDFNACTLNTTCLSGVCQGGAAKCDDRLPCQTGSCTSTTTGNCRYTKVADNTGCTSDGDNCTNDLCLNGACTHPFKCVDGNDCTYDYCNSTNGVCSNPMKGNGAACDDFNACTLNTACLNGVCQGGTAKCDDRLPCQSGNCINTTTGACRYTNVDGPVCNDGDGCTINDACLSGRCQGAVKSCDDGSICSIDRCISPAGTCQHTATHQNDACETDGNQCTNDICINAVCAHNNVLNGTPCDDGNVCTPQSVCVSGACTGQGCSTGTSCGACGQTCQDSPCGCR